MRRVCFLWFARFMYPMQRGLRTIGLLGRALHLSSRQRVSPVVFRASFVTRFTSSNMAYTTEQKGAANSLDYKLYFKDTDGNTVSPFHDIPYKVKGQDGVFNMVVEVPRWTNAKMEIDTKAKMNPIKQDVKKGKLRFVHNCFPHHGYIWNYGALPQTWEDPNHQHPGTGASGDNDPLDVCEIGHKVHKRGAVIQVKPLAVLAMIDEGETDWKVMAIDVTDPLADQLNDMNDIEEHMPGFLAATREWFKIYKIPAGKPENQFAYNGDFKDKAFTLQIIEETHQQWEKLLNKSVEAGGIVCENVKVAGSPFQVSSGDAQAVLDSEPAAADGGPLEAEVDKWHYVKL